MRCGNGLPLYVGWVLSGLTPAFSFLRLPRNPLLFFFVSLPKCTPDRSSIYVHFTKCLCPWSPFRLLLFALLLVVRSLSSCFAGGKTNLPPLFLLHRSVRLRGHFDRTHLPPIHNGPPLVSSCFSSPASSSHQTHPSSSLGTTLSRLRPRSTSR